jgi:hypothetical protein
MAGAQGQARGEVEVADGAARIRFSEPLRQYAPRKPRHGPNHEVSDVLGLPDREPGLREYVYFVPPIDGGLVPVP